MVSVEERGIDIEKNVSVLNNIVEPRFKAFSLKLLVIVATNSSNNGSLPYSQWKKWHNEYKPFLHAMHESNIGERKLI